VFISTTGTNFLEGIVIRYAKRKQMNEQKILEELIVLLEAAGVTIRNESLGGSGGGLCTVKGQKIFFVDTQAQAVDVAALCAEALPKVMDIEKIYIKPEIRQFIENHAEGEKDFGGKFGTKR
jgi:hypothetical protein